MKISPVRHVLEGFVALSLFAQGCVGVAGEGPVWKRRGYEDPKACAAAEYRENSHMYPFGGMEAALTVCLQEP